MAIHFTVVEIFQSEGGGPTNRQLTERCLTLVVALNIQMK